VNGKSVPLTEDEIKACQWRFMKVGPCMKHKISLSQVIDWEGCGRHIARPREEKGAIHAWDQAHKKLGKIYLIQPKEYLAFCMGANPRLGENSSVKMLGRDVFMMICNIQEPLKHSYNGTSEIERGRGHHCGGRGMDGVRVTEGGM
jgi:hypothetical protein